MKQTLNQIAKWYSGCLRTFEAEPRGVNWKDEASQKLRFEKLMWVVHENREDSEISVNDLGCGYGALYNYITKCSLKISKYYGYDISEDMLTAARECIKSEKAIFINSDRVLYIADYSFASGIFNVKLSEDKDVWIKYMEHTLINLNEKSRKGFAFNALSTYVDYEEPHLYYADPCYFFDFCKKRLSKKVSLLHDYDLYEWTIIVRKGDK